MILADNNWHVIPVNDLKPHIDSPKCWCNPFQDDDVYVHHSMDGREKYETGERKPT